MKKLLWLLLLAWLAPAAWTQAVPDPVTVAEQQVLALTNQFRQARGLCLLAFNPRLQRAARSHCEEMARLNYFDHTSPVAGRRYPWDRVNRVGADADSISENLFCADGYSLDSIPALAVANWERSPEHLRHLLDPVNSQSGVGVFVLAERTFVTQVLSSRVYDVSLTASAQRSCVARRPRQEPQCSSR